MSKRVICPGSIKTSAHRIKKAIEERILVAPQDYGTPLRKTLKCYWKLRVGDYRVVYKISDKMVTVLCIQLTQFLKSNQYGSISNGCLIVRHWKGLSSNIDHHIGEG